MQLNIPTILTLFRIATTPLFTLFYYLPIKYANSICALIFFISAITDWFDGFLARYYNKITKFGEFLDPVADKIIVATALVLVTEHFHSLFITIPVMIIIIREIVISALRQWVAKNKNNKITVSRISKIKTTLQMLSLSVLLWDPSSLISTIGECILYFSAIITFWSMFEYLYVVCYNLLIE